MSLYASSKILLIDDEQEITSLLETVLRHEGFHMIYTAHTAEHGLSLFASELPDLVVLDIMLPDGSGYDVFHKLHAIRDVPILFLSAKSEEVDRLLGFALGADDYITKPFSAKEVAFRIKARLRPLPVALPPSKLQFGTLCIDQEASVATQNGAVLELTAKEYKLLAYFMSNPNRIVSKEMICEAVWGEDFFGYDNTITVHVRKLRLKIEADPSHPLLLRTVVGLGYKFTPQE